MDTNNIDNEDDSDDDLDLYHQQVEQEQQAAAAAGADQRHSKIMSVLQRKKEFNLRNRKKIDELIETFLEALEDDIHGMLCDIDSDRDTEKEVENAVRFFPDVLSRRNDEGFCPIQLLTIVYDDTIYLYLCNLKAVSFIPLVARLSIEFGLFEEEARAGLLFENIIGENVLHELMLTEKLHYEREHHEILDNKYLIVMKQVRQMGLLKKEDIQRYGLLRKIIQNVVDQSVFAEKRFRFLVEWNPIALIQTNISGDVPLLQAALYSTIKGFQVVFETGIRYFPKKKGISLLFQKCDADWTPFATACCNYGLKDVINVIEKCLSDCSDKPNSFSEAFLSAAINEGIHLDCVYFLLRRDPNMLQKLLSASPTTPTVKPSKRKRKRNNIDDKGDDGKTCKTYILPP